MTAVTKITVGGQEFHLVEGSKWRVTYEVDGQRESFVGHFAARTPWASGADADIVFRTIGSLGFCGVRESQITRLTQQAKKFRVTAPDGTVSERTSKTMTYAYAVLATDKDGTWGAISWSQSFTNADRAAAGARRWARNVRVVACEEVA